MTDTQIKTTGKVPFVTKLGYGAGTAFDSIPYTLFFTYFVFFLTDYVGIAPAVAGTISFVAIVCQAITGPIFGFFTDNSKNPKGRRRPMILKSMFPYTAAMILMFMPLKASGNAQVIYYGAMAIFMWVCYSAYKGPWDALGAELTPDYNERNVIRFFVGLLAYPCCMLAQSGVIAIVGMAGGETVGWFYGAIICGIVSLAAGIFCYATTKGRENTDYVTEGESAPAVSIKDLFIQYKSILGLKAYRKLVIFMFVFLLGYTVIMNGVTYLLVYNAGMSEETQALYWLINTVTCIALLPIVTVIANAIDKKLAVFGFAVIFIICCAVFYVVGINGMVSAVIFGCGGALGTSAFYGVFYSLIYDCCDIYELKTGERREGGIMAVAQLAQTIGSACASLLLGGLLQVIGYSGDVEPTEEIIHGILTIETIVPAAIVLVSLIFLFSYKMSKERFEEVTKAIEDRRAGIEVDLSRFSDLL